MIVRGEQKGEKGWEKRCLLNLGGLANLLGLFFGETFMKIALNGGISLPLAVGRKGKTGNRHATVLTFFSFPCAGTHRYT